MILDDDHAGVFSFEKDKYEVTESDGSVSIKVVRTSGARGRVLIPYKTVEGTAKGGSDFEVKSGDLIFEDEEIDKLITIGIFNDSEYEKTKVFYVELGDPTLLSNHRPMFPVKLLLGSEFMFVAVSFTSFTFHTIQILHEHLGVADITEDEEEIEKQGMPKLGTWKICTVRIEESYEFKVLQWSSVTQSLICLELFHIATKQFLR
ncbi:unnamed protein product [Soboliphyme baturini]|uniref:Calx-beta domain-containing protein n=1 Tax=Soboliphyme baturini TaxID=241478 RepID=A0A183J923_9BILA|nr:unnamed protein product [Soboliphyme baturini]